MIDDLKKQYDLRFSGFRKYRNEVWKILDKSFFQKYIPRDSDMLDVGCGWGEFINNIEGKRKIAMDLNSDAKTHLKPDVEFINQDCSDEWPLPDNSLDVVFTSNFLEHLAAKSQITRTMIHAKRCLRPGGRLICMGPNIKYLPGLYWDFWDHHIALTEMALSELLEMHDFAIEKRIPRFLPFTMVRKHQPPLFFVSIYLANSFLWKFFGKQFLIVARKSG